jgi:hypothetical protein
MGLLDLLRQVTQRVYLPSVAKEHVVAPYEKAEATASYSHTSGYIVLPVAYMESGSSGSGSGAKETSVAIRLHQPITVKSVKHTGSRHGLLPEVFEPKPGQYVRDDKSVVLDVARSISAPEFGAGEHHGAAFAVAGSTTIVLGGDLPPAMLTDPIPKNLYDGTVTPVPVTMADYTRREV